MNTQRLLRWSLAAAILTALGGATGCQATREYFRDLRMDSAYWQCPSCGKHAKHGCTCCGPDPLCYGYHSTCWYPWPEDCIDCNDLMRESLRGGELYDKARDLDAMPGGTMPPAAAPTQPSPGQPAPMPKAEPSPMPPLKPGAPAETEKPAADGDAPKE
jgi:hypothetical protein